MEMVDSTEKDYLVPTNFRLPKSMHHKLKEISVREGRSIQDILQERILEYIKIHGEGNPNFKLDDWKDPEYKMCPATFSKIEKWDDYLRKCTHEEVQEVYDKFWPIGNLIV